ncbi:MAG: hypothetical protein FJX57_11100, partial [Alphaproteobacteria bacterium]|nr:hypothetical protein [Alphaproteobacteria bacterium]
MQPTLGLRYIVATAGVFPARDDGNGIGGFDTGPILGEIALLAGTLTPGGWASAEGQLLPIASNMDLFSLFGTTYGGDGVTTFALPDLRGRVAVDDGTGVDLTPRTLGQSFGDESFVQTVKQLATHTHDYGSSTEPEPGRVA